jgi:DNA-directed RNA polymerase specialized sigma24 family protein
LQAVAPSAAGGRNPFERYASLASLRKADIDDLCRRFGEDAFQEAALTILIRQMRSGENISEFLPRLAKLRKCDRLRSEATRRRHELAFAQACLRRENPVETGVESKQLGDSLARAIDQLPPRYRAIFAEYLRGKRWREIAASQGLSSASVRGRFYRGLPLLRNALSTSHPKWEDNQE